MKQNQQTNPKLNMAKTNKTSPERPSFQVELLDYDQISSVAHCHASSKHPQLLDQVLGGAVNLFGIRKVKAALRRQRIMI